MMKMMGISVGFDSTQGKYVPGANVSGVGAVTKRQPRQSLSRGKVLYSLLFSVSS